MPNTTTAWLSLALAVAFLPGAASAQEGAALPRLPSDVEDRIEQLRRAPGSMRMTGPVAIPADSVVDADLVVENGSLTLYGTVTRDVLVIGGDLILGPGAEIAGDALVVGGSVEGAEYASLGGTLTSYDDDANDIARERRVPRGDRERRRRHWRDDDEGFDLGVVIATNYNRTEGLPVQFGPVIRTGGPNALHVEAQAIWRTQPSRSLEDEIGYRLRVEQGLFGDRLRIGGTANSRVRPIERRGLNSTEASLAAVLFHSDLHDYYETRDWGFRASLHPRRLPAEARVEFTRAEHDLLEVSDPWSLLRGDDRWRLQPMVGTGDVSLLSGRVTVDTRNDEDEPVRGIYASVHTQRSLDQELTMPLVDFEGTSASGGGFDDFTTASLDLRLHVPVNRSSTFNLRGFLAGTLEEQPLPPQFQHALGGIGTLPGFRLFDGACGARSDGVALVVEDETGAPVVTERSMLPAYGCDRVVLGQVEYRGGFAFDEDRRRDEDEDDDEDHHWRHDVVDVDMHPEWAFFVNAGRGWSFGDIGFADRSDTESMVDVGLGLLFDEAGVYAAMPLTGDDQSLRVVVRLERRF